MFDDFKEFIMRGNVIDLAIGVVVGAAFNSIVNSLVEDILLPPISLLLGKVDFSNLFIPLAGGPFATLAEAQEAAAPTINYGLFLNTLIDFLIIAYVMFMVMRWANNIRKAGEEEEPPAAANTKDCPFCFTSIDKRATRCPNCTSEQTM